MSTLIFYPGIVHSVVAPIDDGISPLSSVFVSAWNLSNRISMLRASQWDIKAYGITSQQQIEFNTATRVHKIGNIITYGIVHSIVWPIDDRVFVPSSSYDIDSRFSVRKNISWKISARISGIRSVRYEILSSLYSHKTAQFNTLQRVFKPGFVVPTWFNQILQPVSHPVSEQASQVTSVSEFNVNKRISTRITSRFNNRTSLIVAVNISFNDHATHVTNQAQITWETKSRISPKQQSAWRTTQRFYCRTKSTWSLHSSVVSSISSQWRTTDHVTKTSVISWNLRKRISKQLTSRFFVYKGVVVPTRVLFNTMLRVKSKIVYLTSSSPGSITTNITHPIVFSVPAARRVSYPSIGQPVTTPIDYQLIPDNGQIPNPGISFRVGINPNGRVSCQAACSFRDLNSVEVQTNSEFDVISRKSFKAQSEFNIYNLVSSDIIIEWIIGAAPPGHIRQLAQVRTDFAY